MLGPRIASLRRYAGFSQGALARRLGISPSAMGMYEQGRRQPSGQLLVAMARELNVTTDYLLTGDPGTIPGAEFSRVLESAVSAAEAHSRRRADPLDRQ